MTEIIEVENKLSEDEIALYDRQIRLWGMAAQANMRSAKVLLINIGSIGTEITKNIVLTGIGHLCILDNHIVQEEDLGSQFFIGKLDVGKSRVDACKARVQDLNPRVDLTFDNSSVDDKDEQFYKQFDLIVATELNKSQISKLNKISRLLNIALYVTGSNGLFSYIFVDLIEFNSVEEKLKSNQVSELGFLSTNKEVIKVEIRIDEEDTKKIFEKVTMRNIYKPFDEMLVSASLEGKLTKRQSKRVSNILPLTFASFDIDSTQSVSQEQLQSITVKKCEQLGIISNNLSRIYVEQFLRQMGVEFAPVAAVIGGAVAQDMINILGKKQSPLNNFIVFDGITLDMPIYEL